MAYHDLIPDELKSLNRFSLDSYLTLFGLPTKMEMGYKQMNDRLVADSNVDDIFAYCLNDCFSLHLINQKRSILAKTVARAQLYNEPLYYALNYSIPYQLLFMNMRAFYKAGYIFMFDNIPTEDSGKYTGAITDACPEDL